LTVAFDGQTLVEHEKMIAPWTSWRGPFRY
jgi:hypothetical protein